MERIQNPDRSMVSPMQGKEFSATGIADTRTFQGASRSFGGGNEVAVKMFAGTRSFFGIKNPWFGAKMYPVEAASLGKGSAKNLLDRVFPVKDARVHAAPLGSKKMPIPKNNVPTGEFAGKGGAQGALDQITDKVHREMTIDDVRELLNNPR